jgi:hypothetical protein
MAQTIQQLIKNRIKSKLQAVVDDNSNVCLQEIHEFPALEFGGFPAATITPIGIEGESWTNSNDNRSYKFKIRVFYEVSRDRPNSIGDAIDALYDVSDRIMNTFTDDKTWQTPTPIQTSLPTGTIFKGVQPVVGEWTQEGEGKLIYTDIELSIHLLLPTNNC